jgi:hypothetical protein
VYLSRKGYFSDVIELIKTLPGDRWQRTFFKGEEGVQALREGIKKTLEWRGRALVEDTATHDYEKNCEEIFRFLDWFGQNIHGIIATESYLSPEVQKVAGKLFDDLDVVNHLDRYNLAKKLLETFSLHDRELPSGLIEMRAGKSFAFYHSQLKVLVQRHLC